MNREQAINAFWNSFGIPAYDENTVPENAPDRKITYNLTTGLINYPKFNTASIWDYSHSWQFVTEKAHDICDGLNNHIVKYDGGAVLIHYDGYQRMNDSNDMVRRILINVNYEFLER